MDVVLTWLQLEIMWVFAASLVAHARDRSRFVGVLRRAGVPIAAAAAIAITIAEGALILVVAADAQVGGAVALVQLAAVTAVVASAQARGRRLDDCGCSSQPEPVGLHLYARNAALGTGALLLVVAGATTSPPAWAVAVAALVVHRGVVAFVPRVVAKGTSGRGTVMRAAPQHGSDPA